MADPALSYTGLFVLQALARGHRFGFDVMEITELPSGTIYPALRRLEALALVRSDWEDEQQAHAEARAQHPPPALHHDPDQVAREHQDQDQQQAQVEDGQAVEEDGRQEVGREVLALAQQELEEHEGDQRSHRRQQDEACIVPERAA